MLGTSKPNNLITIYIMAQKLKLRSTLKIDILSKLYINFEIVAYITLRESNLQSYTKIKYRLYQ